MTPVWKGPLRDGITQSLINKYLTCPYRFFLYAGLGLEEPRQLHPNLIWGDTFHKGLELLIEKDKPQKDLSPEEWDEVIQKTNKHLKEKFPTAPGSFIHTIKRMLALYDDRYKGSSKFHTEVEFREPYETTNGYKVTLRGKVDALSHDRHTLVEHKCKGKIDQVQTSKEVPVDHQVLLYCYITTARTVVYDLIMIPEAQWMLPARRPSQTNDNWAEQLFTSTSGEKFPIAQKKHHWVQQIGPLEINESQIYEFRAFTLDPIIERMYKWFEHVSQPDFDHTNPKFYNEHFYRVPVRHFDPGKTEIFKCDYFDYLTGSGDLDDLVPVKGFYQELSTEE
mgnify:FL=1